MRSSTLSPKIYRIHIFDIIWPQPPCRNILVIKGLMMVMRMSCRLLTSERRMESGIRPYWYINASDWFVSRKKTSNKKTPILITMSNQFTTGYEFDWMVSFRGINIFGLYSKNRTKEMTHFQNIILLQSCQR